MKKIALINMPFGSVYRPSIGLGLLKSALMRDGHEVDVFYFNLNFAERVGLDAYTMLTNIPSSLIGEWMFSKALNGGEVDEETFFARYVTDEQVALKNQCLEMREHVEPFMAESFAATDWSQYDLIGFSSVFEQTTSSLTLAKRIKEQHPNVLIAFGGSNAEGQMGLTLLEAYPFLDVICSGEGDLAFPQYINALDAGEDIHIQGILRQGVDIMPSSTMSVHEMDVLPEPDYTEYFEQFAKMSYAEAEISKTYILYESSRGCWWGAKSHCKFCGLNGSNMNFRSKNAQRAFDELISLKDRYSQYTQRFFAVDNIIDYKYFKDLLPMLRDNELDLDLFYETKANLTREQVQLFRDANINMIQPGIESLSSSILKIMGKGVSGLQNIQLLKLCKEFGVLPIWNTLYGFPGEDPDEYTRLANMVPALTHLDPPSGWYQIRLDRFSPYFNNTEMYGMTNVRPFVQYGLVHNKLTPKQHFDMAYYFEFDYADGRNPSTYIGPLAEQLQMWIERNRRDFLFFDVIDEKIYMFNYRQAFPKGLIVLHEADREMYELLDQARSFDVLYKMLTELGHTMTEEELQTKLDQFVKHGLVITEDDRYLAVAIKLGEYKVPRQVYAAFLDAVEKTRAKEAVTA